VIVGHPLDLIKVRVQTAAPGVSTSVLGMLRQTLKTEGVNGLYRGVSAPITAVTPMFAVSFWSYDMGQRVVSYVANIPDEKKNSMSVGQLVIAGGLSAFPTVLIMAPSERIKCLLQIQANDKSKPPKYKSMMHCATSLYAEGGIRSIYKGTVITLARDIPGSMAYFGMYEFIKRQLSSWQGLDNPNELSFSAILTAGGFAGMACWGASMPMDVVKSRYQTHSNPNVGVLEVYQGLVREEGYSALVRGMRPALIRAFPANAACFFGMELSRKAMAFLD